MHRNSEGYPDPTAGKAMKEAGRPPEAISEMLRIFQEIAGKRGYEITGRITFRDKKTKHEWR